MGEDDLCVKLNYGCPPDRHTHTQTNKQTHRHIDTMTQLGQVKFISKPGNIGN